MERSSPIRQAVLLVLRYAAAVIASSFTLYAALGPAVAVGSLAGKVGFSLAFIPVGFASVMAGTYCLPPRSRLFGAIVLLGLGLGYCALFWGPLLPVGSEPDRWAFPLLLLLGLGGAVAVVLRLKCFRNYMESHSQVKQAVLLFLRFIGAVIVALVASYTALVPFGAVGSFFGKVGFSLAFIPISFAGVMAGTFCLPQRGRSFGSIVLLALGLGYYVVLWTHLKSQGWGPYEGPFPLFLPLAVGGAAAVVFFLARQLKKPAEPINVPPIISGP